MRTFRYHKTCPEGKIFDTEPGKKDPLVPDESLGWFDSPARLNMTTDQIVEAAVKAELAKQKDRPKLDKEFKKKTGEVLNFMASEKLACEVLDSKESFKGNK